MLEIYDTSDLVWVHDYHLLLLPSYILRKVRNARVGLFVHTPFPSSEIFRTVSVRDELLRGMLNADVVGFHIFECAARPSKTLRAMRARLLTARGRPQVRAALPHVLQADARAPAPYSWHRTRCPGGW